MLALVVELGSVVGFGCFQLVVTTGFVVGIVVTVLLWQGLDMVFPDAPLWLALPFRALRYFIVVMWVAYFAPKLFVRLNLATGDPKPEINLTL